MNRLGSFVEELVELIVHLKKRFIRQDHKAHVIGLLIVDGIRQRRITGYTFVHVFKYLRGDFTSNKYCHVLLMYNHGNKMHS